MCLGYLSPNACSHHLLDSPVGQCSLTAPIRKSTVVYFLSHQSHNILLLCLESSLIFFPPANMQNFFFSKISCFPGPGVHDLSMPKSIVCLLHGHCQLWGITQQWLWAATVVGSASPSSQVTRSTALILNAVFYVITASILLLQTFVFSELRGRTDDY